MEVYRQLRKEGVLFPKRETKNQFLIKFEGKKSPIFETIEGNNIYEVGLTVGTGQDPVDKRDVPGEGNQFVFRESGAERRTCGAKTKKFEERVYESENK